MITEKRICHERQKQAEICIDLHQYRTGAETMLKLTEKFNLRGDFSEMEQIQAEVSINCLLTYTYHV